MNAHCMRSIVLVALMLPAMVTANTVAELTEQKPELCSQVLLQLAQSLPSTYPMVAPQVPMQSTLGTLPATPPVVFSFYRINQLNFSGATVTLPAAATFTWNMIVVLQ